MDIACNLGHHELVIFLIGNGAFRDTTKKLQMKDKFYFQFLLLKKLLRK